MSKSLRAFTLIEICVAIAVALMIMLMAVPSIQAVFAERDLKATVERLDDLVREAQMLSVAEHRAFVLRWEKSAIVLRPEELGSGDQGREWARLDFADKEVFEIERPQALAKKPAPEWVFWRSGNCEPVTIRYQGAAGSWTARYDGLTARASFFEQELR